MQRYFQNFMVHTRWNRYFLFQNLFPKIPHSIPYGFWNAGAWFMGIGLGIGILGIQLQWECGMWISRRRWSRIWNWIGLIQSLLGLQSQIRISYGLRTLETTMSSKRRVVALESVNWWLSLYKADFALGVLEEPSLCHEPRILFNMPVNTMKLQVMFRKPEMTRDPLAPAQPYVETLSIAILLWLVTNMVVLSIFKLVSVWVICANVSFMTLATDSIFWPMLFICWVGIEDMPEQNSLRMAVFTVGSTAAHSCQSQAALISNHGTGRWCPFCLFPF